MTVPTQSDLPLGTEIRLNATTRSYAGGTVLLGGSPMRLVRLGVARTALRDSTSRDAVTDARSAALADRLLHIGIVDVVLDSVPAISLDQLTVVVPVYGEAEALDRLLTALDGVPAIVVDDASSDAFGINCVATKHSATLLRLPVNSGPAAARNHGLQQVKTPYVAFCDADTVVTRSALEHLLRHFHDRRVAIAAPRIVDLKDAAKDSWITRYEAVRSSLDLGSTSGIVRPHSRVGWIPSACFLTRIEALAAGFDESMRMGEDVDLVWRLAAQGWIVRYDADVTVAHEHRRSIRTWLGRKYRYGTSAAELAARHGNAVAPAVLSPSMAIMNGALLLQRRWSIGTAIGAFIFQAFRVQRQLGRVDGRRFLALYITARGATESLEQTSRLLVRTWLPITVLIALISRRARLAALVATICETGMGWFRLRPPLDIARFAFARQLDDAADGAGAWTGAWRSRSANCLMPAIQTAAPRWRKYRPDGPRSGRAAA